MKIKTNLIHRKGRKVSFGKDVVEFNNEGIAEVAPELAEIILAKDKSLSVFDENGEQISDEIPSPKNNEIPSQTKVEVEVIKGNPEIVENKTEIEGELEGVEESESLAETLNTVEEVNEEISELANMTVKELYAIAKEAKLPNSEWANLKKDQLVTYLSSKIAK